MRWLRGKGRIARTTMALLVSGALVMQGVPTAAFAESAEPLTEAEPNAEVAVTAEAEARPEAAALEHPAHDAEALLGTETLRVADELRVLAGDDEARLTEAALAQFGNLALLDADSPEQPDFVAATTAALSGQPTTAQGAARAFVLVLDALGVATVSVTGVQVGEAPAPTWLLVRVHDAWYHVDLASYLTDIALMTQSLEQQEEGGEPASVADVREVARDNWLLVSDETIALADEAHATWEAADDAPGSELPVAERDYAWQDGEDEEEAGEIPSEEAPVEDEAVSEDDAEPEDDSGLGEGSEAADDADSAEAAEAAEEPEEPGATEDSEDVAEPEAPAAASGDDLAPLPEAQQIDEGSQNATAPADPLATTPADPGATGAEATGAEEGLAAASNPVTSGEWTYETYYELDENENYYPVFAITGYTGTATKITIPSTLDGNTMYGVAPRFALGPATEVTISSGIEYLYSGAFENATQLTKVTFASSSKVKRIGQRTFRNTSISQLILPDSVEEIGIEALSYCPNLTKVHLSANLEPMYYELMKSYGTFDNEWMYVPTYYDPAFRSPNVTWDVSASCKNYKVVNGALYSKDGSVLYRYPAGQASVTIPTGVTHIASYAFMEHGETLTSVSLPNTLESIGPYAFAYTGLTKVTCPSSLTTICDGAFYGCASLREVSLDAALGDIGLGGDYQFRECSSLSSVTIPEGVTGISWGCFNYCTSLTKVQLPSSVQKVRPYAFSGCSALAQVSGCAGVRSVDAYAFAGTAISSFPFGEQCTFVSGYAFYRCSNYGSPAYPSYMMESGGDWWVYDDEYVITGTESYTMAQEVLDLVNKERATQGLGALVMDATLQEAAMQRAAETSLYFEHTRPTGTDCFTACTGMAAENIAAGSSTAQAVMNQWMNSSGHRANILNSSMKCVGIGCIKVGSVYYWTQCFGRGTGSGGAAESGTRTASRRVDVMYHVIKLDGSGFNLNERLADSFELRTGATKTLTVGVMNGGWSSVYCPLDPTTCTWTSSKPAVATVSAKGVVTGKAAGTATITATTKGGKSWQVAVSVYAPIAISKVDVSAIADCAYTGRAIQPSPEITYQGKTLAQGTDYELSYKNNVEVGTATVTITGLDRYTGSRSVTFKIKKSIRGGHYGYNYPYYTGSAVTMPVTVYDGNGVELVEGTDYELSFSKAVNVGEALVVTVTGIGEFTGTFTIEETVRARRMSLWRGNGSTENLVVVADVADQAHTGKAITPKPKVTFNGTILKEGKDFTYSYEDNVSIGYAYVYVKAVEGGNFTGSVYSSFRIVGDIANAQVSAIPDQPYTGWEIEPNPAVTLDGTTLYRDYDYTLSYADNVKVSNKATVTVTGTGNYVGTKKLTFRIAFKDMSTTHWAYKVVHRANDLGIINGFADGSFGPDKQVTRGQVAVMLWNMAGRPAPGAGAKAFPDNADPKAFYYRAVQWASSVGVVNGFADGTFGPGKNVTREQLSTMLANYARRIGGLEVVGSAADYASMVDAASVSGYARTSVGWCFRNKIISGKTGGRIDPQGSATRAETAKMVVFLYDMLQ